jgi:hypothetical protein
MSTMRCNTISSAFYRIQRLTIVAGVLLLLLMSLVAVSQFVSQDNARSNKRHVISTAAYGQLTTQDGEGIDSATETMNTTTTAIGNGGNSNNLQSASSFVIRGPIGGIIVSSTTASTDQGNQTNQDEGAQGYVVVAGRWRMVVNQSLVERFVANLTIVGIDGRSPSYNVIAEDVGGLFDLQRNDNVLISEITAKIYPSNNRSASIITPVQVEVRGNNIVQIVPLGIDNRMLGAEEETKESQLQILRSIDRQAIYGIIQTTEITG